MAKRKLPNRWDTTFYRGLRFILQQAAMLGYRFRCHDMHKMLPEGRGLVCSNHQSNLDPLIIGLAIDRDLNFLAKRSLFEGVFLKHLMHPLHCIPINREMGISGIKETLRRLRDDRLVLMFPEGTRSRTGEMLKFKSGVLSMARKTNSPLIPCALEGAFDAYPPSNTYPKLGCVHMVLGDPIMPEQYNDMEEDDLLELLESRVRECFEKARRKREHHMSLNIRNRQPKWRLSKPAGNSS